MDNSSQWILIDQGVYKEAVNVTRTGPTTLLGQTDHPSSFAGNLVTVFNTTYINQKTQNASVLDNADSQVLTGGLTTDDSRHPRLFLKVPIQSHPTNILSGLVSRIDSSIVSTWT